LDKKKISNKLKFGGGAPVIPSHDANAHNMYTNMYKRIVPPPREQGERRR